MGYCIEFCVVITIILLVVPRPCDVKSSRESERRRKCRRKCILKQENAAKKKLIPDVVEPLNICYEKCLLGNSNPKREKHHEGNNADFEILGPGDAVPDDLILTGKVPHVPKKLRQLGNPLFRTNGNCDHQPSWNVFDEKVKTALSCTVKFVSYIKRNNNVVIQWQYPQDLKKVFGYQIIYQFTADSGTEKMAKSYCYIVDKTKNVFTVDSSKGFKGQNSILVSVTTLPLPVNSDLILHKYDISFIEKKSSEIKQRITRDAGNKNETENDPVILGPDDTLPPDLIIPSTMPKSVWEYLKKRTKTSNCLAPKMSSNKTVYAGQADILGVYCQQAGKYNKKGFSVHWTFPKDYKNIKSEGYQIYYSIMPKRTYDPERQFCVQVKAGTQSYTITNVDSTDTVHVAVLSYPVYDNITFYLKKFTPCAQVSPTGKLDGRNGSSEKPFRIEVIVGIVAVAIVCMVGAAVILHLKRRKGFNEGTTPTSGLYYVSYYPDTKKYHNSLVHLIAKLRKVHSLNMIMDCMCRTQIDELGLPRWCIQQLSDARKVIIVMSKGYLKVCQEWKLGVSGEKPTMDANRVCLELQYVVDKIFENRKNTNVLIVLADVKANELPDFLRNRPTISWPKDSEELNSLACSICDVEELNV